MSNLSFNSAQIASFKAGPHFAGIDLNTTRFKDQPGWYQAASGETIRAGQLVSLNSGGKLVLATSGAAAFGISKFNKMTLGQAAMVDDVIVVDAGAVTTLSHPNLVANTTIVRTASDQGGTVVTATGDYTLNTTNGTLTWEAVPAQVTDGQTVYVSYTYSLVAADYDAQGRNFTNTLDDATPNQGRLTIMQGDGTLFTTEFDTAQTYALDEPVYWNATLDVFSNQSASSVLGKVIQVPSATYPYLGMYLRIPAL